MSASSAELSRSDPPASATSSASLIPALVLALVVSLVQLDVTIAAVILPVLDRELGLGSAGAAWVVDAYSLALVSVLLAAGALADRHGRRRILSIGLAGFGAGSLGCALAWSGPALWAARAAQGGAAACLVTGALASLSAIYAEPVQRGRAFGIVGVISGGAMALGPTLGGLVAQAVGWRWLFLVNLPLCAAGIWILPRLIPETRDPAGRPLDWAGIALLTLGLILPVRAMLDAGETPWRALELGTGLAALLLFVVRQARRPRPMLDPALLLAREPAGLACVLVALSLGYWAVLIHLPLFLSAAFRWSTEQTGLAMLAATLPMLAAPPLGPALARHWGWSRIFPTGLALVAAGVAMLAVAASTAAPRAALAAMVAIGTGAGAINSQASGALIALAPPAQAGMASALATILRQASFAVGVAGLGAATQVGEAYAWAFAATAGATGAGALVSAWLLKSRGPAAA